MPYQSKVSYQSARIYNRHESTVGRDEESGTVHNATSTIYWEGLEFKVDASSYIYSVEESK